MSDQDLAEYGVVLEVRRLCKSFKRYSSEWKRVSGWIARTAAHAGSADSRVLQDISFKLHKGEAIGLVGANGAGKSTLLKILSGTTVATSGSFEIKGRVSSILELGMGFNVELDADTNARHALGLMGLTADEIRQSINSVRDFAEIGAAWFEPLRTYSSGMQMRVAFAVVTAKRPEVLIVDEALSVGDAYFQHKCMDRIRSFRNLGTSLLLVSHDPGAILGLCSRVLLLDRGSVLMDGEAAVVMDFYNALIAERENEHAQANTEAQSAMQHRRPDGLVQTESGTGAARFTDVRLLDSEGLPLEYVQSGSPLSLVAEVDVLSQLPRLVFGFMIKDRLGQPVFGTNTFHQEKIVTNLSAGQRLRFQTDFDANLGPGSYSVSLALTSSDTHLVDNFQWRDVAIVFRVYNDAEPYFLGTARLVAPISVSEVSDNPSSLSLKSPFATSHDHSNSDHGSELITGLAARDPRSDVKLLGNPHLKKLVHRYLEAETSEAPWSEEALRVAISDRWMREDLARTRPKDADRKHCLLCGQDFERSSWVKRESHCQFGGGRLLRWQCPGCDLIAGDEKMLALSPTDLAWEYRLHYRCYSESDCTAAELRAFYALNPQKGKYYLNWGAGGWSQTILLLRGLGFEVWGYDPYIDHSLNSENNFFINRDEIFLRRFDGIFSNNVIEHAPDPVAFLVDTGNLLRPGGSLAHASPCWEYSFEYTRFHLYFFPGRCREILFNKAGLALAKWLVDWQAKGAPFLCPILKRQSDATKLHSDLTGLLSHATHLAKAVSDKPVAIEDTQHDDMQHGPSLREDVFVSYAQNREDVLIWRALGGIPNGIYVDVGAGHPIKDSVTKALYDRGWRGLNIDADPRSVARLKQERLRDRSIHCLVGDGRTGVIWLSDEPLSSSSSECFAGTSAMPLGVATRSLQSLIEENQGFIGDAIHLLKIDVEGDECSVLKSLDLKAFRPWLIVVEATMPHTQSEAYRSWEPQLSDAYYDFVWFDGLNRYYLAAERMDLRESLSLAPNIFDRYISYDQKISADYFLASVREDDAIHFRRSANRPKLAYCSPMPPDASGIAYYACHVLDDLALRYDITVVTTSGSTTEPGVASKFRVIGFSEFHSTLSEYERIMYHIGNNASFHASMLLLLAHRRATLVLHDTFVGDLLAYFMQQSLPQEPERALALPDWLNHTDSAQKLAALLFDGYGLGALLVYRRLGLAETFRRFPMLSGMLRHAGSVVVHSGHAESEIRRFGSEQFIDRPRLMRTMLPRVPERSLDGKPRGLADVLSRQLDRRSLGLRESDFLLVSLGYLRPGKCCQELLAGFAAFAREQMAIEGESRASTGQLRLVFVGAYSDLADPWSTSFQASVESLCDEGVQVQVTGWVSDAAYRSWIGAADVAVQLRQDSRGESSGSALDAMAFGLPLVVNRHGSLAELGAACVLSSLDELPGALGRIYRDEAYRLDLSRKSWVWVKDQHSPSMVASAYTRAIEAAARSSDPVGALAIPAQRTLWIDVSVLAKVDSGTGIQRVVRAIANHLIEPISSAGLRVELVHLHQRLEEPFCIRRALRLSERWLGMTPEALGEESIVLPQAGDIYLLLDLHTDAVSRNEALFAALASRGIRLHAVVYDLLPISNPEWFPNDAARSFIDWAQVVAKHACGLHAISKASAFAVRSLLAPAGKVEWFHLGADIESSLPFEDSDEGLEELDMALKQRSGEPAAPIVLMVSTVEPRKGHMQALDAFEALWHCTPSMAEGQPIATNKPNWSQARLVIVGHLGWCVDHLRDRLEGHPERGRRLFWLSKLSDQSLLQLYRRADLFLMASEGEGFGLPIVEAARHGVPLLLRDLPVFRELADGYAMWFDTDKKLSGALVKALDQIAAGSAPRSNDMPLLSWEESAAHLADQLLADVGLRTLESR